MWNKKVEVIPITIGATGIVEKDIQSYLHKIPGKHNLYNLQRSVILGTAHILRKVLSIKPELSNSTKTTNHVSPRCRDYT